MREKILSIQWILRAIKPYLKILIRYLTILQMAFDMRLALMCGTDIPIPECQLIVHQPRLREIALIGDSDFFTGVQTLSVNKNMIA